MSGGNGRKKYRTGTRIFTYLFLILYLTHLDPHVIYITNFLLLPRTLAMLSFIPSPSPLPSLSRTPRDHALAYFIPHPYPAQLIPNSVFRFTVWAYIWATHDAGHSSISAATRYKPS